MNSGIFYNRDLHFCLDAPHGFNKEYVPETSVKSCVSVAKQTDDDLTRDIDSIALGTAPTTSNDTTETVSTSAPKASSNVNGGQDDAGKRKHSDSTENSIDSDEFEASLEVLSGSRTSAGTLAYDSSSLEDISPGTRAHTRTNKKERNAGSKTKGNKKKVYPKTDITNKVKGSTKVVKGSTKEKRGKKTKKVRRSKTSSSVSDEDSF